MQLMQLLMLPALPLLYIDIIMGSELVINWITFWAGCATGTVVLGILLAIIKGGNEDDKN